MAAPVTAPRAALAIRFADCLNEDELRRLSWLQGTLAARTHLERQGLPSDSDACRRLAFGLWLKASGRLDGEFTPTHDS